jgi:hypothetical protein
LIKDSKIYRDNKQKGRSHSASEYRRLTSWQTVANKQTHCNPWIIIEILILTS